LSYSPVYLFLLWLEFLLFQMTIKVAYALGFLFYFFMNRMLPAEFTVFFLLYFFLL